MVIVKFKNEEHHEDVLRKVKRMKKFTEELEDWLEECEEDEEADFRGSRYRHEYDEDDMRHDGRYAYRRGRSRM